jgi:hypothetical protein
MVRLLSRNDESEKNGGNGLEVRENRAEGAADNAVLGFAAGAFTNNVFG